MTMLYKFIIIGLMRTYNKERGIPRSSLPFLYCFRVTITGTDATLYVHRYAFLHDSLGCTNDSSVRQVLAVASSLKEKRGKNSDVSLGSNLVASSKQADEDHEEMDTNGEEDEVASLESVDEEEIATIDKEDFAELGREGGWIL